MTIASVVLKTVTLHGYPDPFWIRLAALYRVVTAFGLLAFLAACNPQDTPDNGQSGEIRQAFDVEDLEALEAEVVSLRAELKRIIEGRDTLKVEDLVKLGVVRKELELMEALLEALEHVERSTGYEVKPTFPGQRRPTAGDPK